jgi:hypothetical protein
MKHFAGTVTIDQLGKPRSVLWDSTTFPEDNYYFALVERMQEVVESGRVVGPMKDERTIWGFYAKGGFEHFAITAPTYIRHVSKVQTARQRQAELREDYRNMARFFETPEGSLENLRKLMKLLESGALAGDELIDGSGRWLYHTALEREAAQDKRVRENLLWRAVSSAKAGFAHPTTTLVGTVLEGLLKGDSFESIKKQFGAKTVADKLHRPTAPPTLNQLQIAEKRVEVLGVQQSLRRRVAYFTDIPERAFIWHERAIVKAEAEKPAGVFGHLAAKAKDAVSTTTEDLQLPPVTMSWNKFIEDVLPKAQDIEIYVPNQLDYFAGLAAAAVDDAPPILMYDFDDARNTVTAYQRSGKDFRGQLVGVGPDVWALQGNTYNKVRGIITAPHLWNGNQFPQLGQQIFFLIDGMYDRQAENGDRGIALFPALLKGELREIERVVEHFSNEATFEGDPKQQIGGLTIVKGGSFRARRLKLQTEFGPRVIIIDRWE